MSSNLDEMTTILTTELDSNVTLPFADEQDTAAVGLSRTILNILKFSSTVQLGLDHH